MRLVVPVFALIVCTVFALAVGLAALSVVSGRAVNAAERTVAQADQTVSGVVASVDADNLMIIMRTRFGRAQAFPVVNADLLKDVRQGDAITVELDDQGVARRITKTGGR